MTPEALRALVCRDCGRYLPPPSGEWSCKCKDLTLFLCGPAKCDHDWSGPFVEIDGGRSGSATCVKCGARAIDEAMWL
jgi:hypothetical protein